MRTPQTTALRITFDCMVTPALRPDHERVVALLREMIAIDSVNPELAGATRGEAPLAEYIQHFAAARGLPSSIDEVLPGRPNVLVRLTAPAAKGTLLLEAHMDTVPHQHMPDGLLPRVGERRVYGRGACDTKGGLAAMLHALELLQEHQSDLAVNVVLAATIDEEHAFRGVNALVARGERFDAAIVAEPTSLEVVTAHRGVLRCRLRTLGRAAHTSKPDEGDNAIYQMAHVVALIRDELVPRVIQRHHALCGNAALSVSMIHGGIAINIVPSECQIDIDRRVLPNEEPQEVLHELQATLNEVSRRRPEVRVELAEVLLMDAALDTPPEAPIVQMALRVAREVRGTAEPRGAPFGTDASKLARAGVPSIVLGPGSIDQAHSANEWVPIDELGQAAALYAGIVLEYSASQA